MLPKTKPFSVGILYRPPSFYNFLDDLNESFYKLSPETTDIFILGDMNINVFLEGKNIFRNAKTYTSSSSPVETILKKYKEFCSTFSLVQMINSPTRITNNSVSLIDHVLTNSSDKISNSGVIDTGLSDHQLIFCTRKLVREKVHSHKNIKCRSFKNYTPNDFILKLQESNFHNYNTFDDIDDAYNDFSNKLLLAINEVAPSKEVRIKSNNQEWFDGEVLEAISTRDKFFRIFKKSRLREDEINYKQSKYFAQDLINCKKKSFFENKLKETIGRPKELWKNLKDIGLPKKVKSVSNNFCLKNNGVLSFDLQENMEIFKNFYNNLAQNLLDKLPNPTLKFDRHSLLVYYQNYNICRNAFKLSNTNEEDVLEILKNIDPTKASGIDNISGRFIKDGATILAKPISQLCNLSIK